MGEKAEASFTFKRWATFRVLERFSIRFTVSFFLNFCFPATRETTI